MSDVYIVYASEDREIAKKLHGLLKNQWDVWWDRKMVDAVHEEIETEIAKAGCIVPLVTKHSRTKETVIAELLLGKDHNKKIIPLKLDGCLLACPFNARSHIDMHGWQGEADHCGLLELKEKLAGIVPPAKPPKRPSYIDSIAMPLPMLFLSVSSHETQLPPSQAVRALRLFGVPHILVSAYDLIPHCRCKSKPCRCRCEFEYKSLLKELNRYRDNGGFVLIDSGKYEASRLADKSWTADKLKKALSLAPHDWVFCFDDLEPSKGCKKSVNDLIAGIQRDRTFTSAPVLPIVHTPRFKNGKYKFEHVPWIVREVAGRLKPKIIAIPERELGDGLIARAKQVQRIREELDKLPFYQPLHLLGTGNPWSIPIFAAAGADTFDGLEWCRTVVDRETNRLHHFQHFDFFTYQKGRAESDIARIFLNDDSLNFTGKAIFHNIDHYVSIMKDIREDFGNKKAEAYIAGILGTDIKKQLIKEIPGIFK